MKRVTKMGHWTLVTFNIVQMKKPMGPQFAWKWHKRCQNFLSKIQSLIDIQTMKTSIILLLAVCFSAINAYRVSQMGHHCKLDPDYLKRSIEASKEAFEAYDNQPKDDKLIYKELLGVSTRYWILRQKWTKKDSLFEPFFMANFISFWCFFRSILWQWLKTPSTRLGIWTRMVMSALLNWSPSSTLWNYCRLY